MQNNAFVWCACVSQYDARTRARTAPTLDPRWWQAKWYNFCLHAALALNVIALCLYDPLDALDGDRSIKEKVRFRVRVRVKVA